MSDVTVRSRLSSWAYALRTTNPPPDGPVDIVTRWIVVTRAAVLPMTLFAGLVAALLAVGRSPDWIGAGSFSQSSESCWRTPSTT